MLVIAIFAIFRAGIISLDDGVVALLPSTFQMLPGMVPQLRIRVGDFPPEVGIFFVDQRFQLRVGKVDLVLGRDKAASRL